MRLPRMRFTIRSMMVAVVLLGVASWAFARYQRCSSYDTGWWEAEREIWRGELTIYESVGGGGFDDTCNIDQVTGLSTQRFSGCVIDREQDKQIQGHNDHVMQYIRWHGLPEYSLKRWEEVLFGLASYFDAGSRIESPKRLLAGGPALIAPDGRVRVQPVLGRKYDGEPADDALDLIISNNDVVVARTCIRDRKGECTLVWGPPGSGFVVVRNFTDHSERFAAYKLPCGQLLREETWIRTKDGSRGRRWTWILDPI